MSSIQYWKGIPETTTYCTQQKKQQVDRQLQEHRGSGLSYADMVTADTIIQPGTQCSPVSTEGKYKMRIRSKLFMARYHQNVKKLPFQVLLAISSLFIVQTGTSGTETSIRVRGSPVQRGTFDPTTGGPLDIQPIRRGGVTADRITEPATQCVPQSTGGNYKMRNRSKLFMLGSHSTFPLKCERNCHFKYFWLYGQCSGFVNFLGALFFLCKYHVFQIYFFSFFP